MGFSKIAVRAATGAALVLGAFVFAAPATADTATDYQVDGANIRAAADGHSPSIGRGYIGDGVTMICSTYGPAVEGTRTEYWILSRNHRTGVQGWSAGSSFAGIINRTPRC